MDEFAPPVALRFDRERVPTPGPVTLLFGDDVPAPEPVPAPGVRLVFSQSPVKTPGPVRLVFGETGDAPVIPEATLHGAGQITGLRLRVALRAGAQVQATGRITGLRLRIKACYDVNVSRPTVGRIASRWQDAAPAFIRTRDRWQQTAPMPVGVRQGWQDAAPLAAANIARWHDTLQMHRAVGTRFEQADRLPTAALLASYQQALALRHDTRAAFEEALRLPTAPTRVAFETGLQLRAGGLQRFEVAAPAWHRVRSGMGVAVGMGKRFGSRFEQAMPPRPGQWQRPGPKPPGEPCYVPGLPARLLFAAAHDASLPARLVFICERAQPPGPQPGGETIVVPVRRVYIVLNNITLHRVDTGAELHAHSFSMSLDHQSWTWQWHATLHHDAAGHLGRDSQGDPAELEVMVNGLPFRLRLESVTRDRRFNPTRWGVSGKGKAAILDAPWAPTMSFGNAAPRTAQQLMADALTINGVSLGWGIDWGLTDWAVPAGAWALQGSYIAAINDIAAAAGGYVQPHSTDDVLRILPRYPAAPWNWSDITPDFEIPADAAEVEGTQYVDRPGYNGVFVGGVGAGVFGPFKRAGSAGNVIAPQVTHPLITHLDAFRQRGLAEISDTGRQEHVTLSMQVLPETGVITPGQFVRYAGDKTVMGIVRSTSIDWRRPTLRQTIGIETHA